MSTPCQIQENGSPFKSSSTVSAVLAKQLETYSFSTWTSSFIDGGALHDFNPKLEVAPLSRIIFKASSGEGLPKKICVSIGTQAKEKYSSPIMMSWASIHC